MHHITELRAWERLLKRIVWEQLVEYIDDKIKTVNELCRLLRCGGRLSVVKHNRAGRVMQMAVLLDDMEKANDLLDGKDSMASQFGQIRYYEDKDILKWNSGLIET